MKTADTHKEAYYQSKIIQHLRKTYPAAFVWKATQGMYSNHNGVPDICVILSGHFFGFEVKRPGGKPSKLQEAAINAINEAGGTALVVTYPEQVDRAIREAMAAAADRNGRTEGGAGNVQV